MNRFQEQLLVRRLKRRDGRAAEEFIDSFGARVHALARRYTRTDTDAEDLTQEIFIDLCRAIHGFRGEAALSTWVYRVALNHCLKHRRGQETRPEALPLDEERDGLEGTTADPVRHAAHAELTGRIDAALADLTPEHREVVVLHEMHGLTYSECASVLGIPIGTVKSRLFNAFKRLRGGMLGDYVRETEGEIAFSTPVLAGIGVAVNASPDATTTAAAYGTEKKGDARR